VRVVLKALPESLSADLIAPCGMNCALCSGHMREKNRCVGCNGDDASKPNYCLSCRIKTCDEIASGTRRYCYGCDRFPCQRLRQLDKRYRTKYGMSMLENLLRIEEIGAEAFVDEERAKWTCPECGALLCVHRPECGQCGHVW